MADVSDPTLLFFAACAGFAGLFLLISVASGALHGHGVHAHSAHPAPTAQAGHTAQVGHSPPAAPAGHAPAGHAPAGHAPAGHTSAAPHAAPHGAPAHAAHHAPLIKHAPHTHHAPASHDAAGAHAHHQGDFSAHTASHTADHAAHSHAHDGHGHDSVHDSVHEGAGGRLQGYWHGLASLVVRSLNLYAILTFLFFFGVSGLLLYTNPFMQTSRILLFTVATVVGLLAALVCSAVLSRLFEDTSGLVTDENSRLRGREVKVLRRIRVGGTGEVIFVPRGGVAQNIPARSMDGQAIPVGQSVVIMEVSGGVALVEQLDLGLDPVGDRDEGTDGADP